MVSVVVEATAVFAVCTNYGHRYCKRCPDKDVSSLLHKWRGEGFLLGHLDKSGRWGCRGPAPSAELVGSQLGPGEQG